MPLKVSDGIGAWIKDFQKSDAPQFKGHSSEKRREQAIAAYLSAKRGPQNESTNIEENPYYQDVLSSIDLYTNEIDDENQKQIFLDRKRYIEIAYASGDNKEGKKYLLYDYLVKNTN